jgi:hypothetical protein
MFMIDLCPFLDTMCCIFGVERYSIDFLGIYFLDSDLAYLFIL